MKKELKERWIAALRSGEYKQGNSYLRHDNNYCCLGVLCDIEGVPFSDNQGYCFNSGDVRTAFLPNNFLSDYNLPYNYAKRLAAMNDAGKSFEEIADFIYNYISED